MLWHTTCLPYSWCRARNILVSLYLCIHRIYFSLLPSVSGKQSKIPECVRLIHRLWGSQAKFVAVLSQQPGPSTGTSTGCGSSLNLHRAHSPQCSYCTPLSWDRGLERILSPSQGLAATCSGAGKAEFLLVLPSWGFASLACRCFPKGSWYCFCRHIWPGIVSFPVFSPQKTHDQAQWCQTRKLKLFLSVSGFHGTLCSLQLLYKSIESNLK